MGTPLTANVQDAPCVTLGSNLRLDPVPWADAVKSEALVAQWQHWLSRMEGTNPLESSPIWLQHEALTGHEVQLLKVMEDDASGQQTLLGVAPVKCCSVSLLYDLASRPLYNVRLSAIALMGSQPLIPHTKERLHRFFREIFRQFPDRQCIYIERVPTDSSMWSGLSQLKFEQRDFLVHAPYGKRPWHLLQLQETFDAYLSSLKSKTRSTLKRKIAQYEKTTGQSLSLRRYESADEIAEFLQVAAAVSADTWQKKIIGEEIGNNERRRAQLRLLAERQLVRSYILFCGEKPQAFLLGYQFQDTYHYVQTGFLQSMDHLSPGTVLLYLVIRDLHESNRPCWLDFGMGDGVHKRRFGSVMREDTTVVLLRPHWMNRLRQGTHTAFLKSVEFVKKCVGRRVSK